MSIFRRFFGVLTIAFCCVFAVHSAWANFYITTTTTGYYQHAPTVCIKAKGSFFVDWGDGGTDSCHNSIVKSCCKTHTYSDNSISHTVEISGQPTEYADYTNATFDAQPTIAFCNWGNPYLFHCAAPWVAGISGSIGEIFPTLGNGNNPGQQPSFSHTFGSMPNLTGTIPANLFNGVHGTPVRWMFSNLFFADTGLTGSIPSNLFSGITGTAVGAFAHAFGRTTHLNCHVPAGLFHNIVGNVPQSMFYETFAGSPENGPDDGFCTESGTYGWIAPDAFSISRLYGTPFSNYQMYRMFYKSGLAQSCPSGYTQWVTGFEDDWDGRKACVPSSMTLTTNCGEGTGNGTSMNVSYNDNVIVGSPSSWGCTAPAGETFSHWAVSNSTDTYNAGQQFNWHYVQNKVFTAVWEGHYYNFALNHKDGSNNVNTVYEKYNTGWATSANASSWNWNMILPQDTVRDGYTLRGYYDYDFGDVSSNDTVSETEAYYHMKIKYDSSSSGWKLPAPTQAPGATWYAAWARNCAPVAPATCSLQIAPHTGSVTYVTTCPEGYNKVNGTSYNPSCTPVGVTITLNNNDATSAGTTSLTTAYGVGVYLDGTLMTTSGPSITKPQKQFTVTYYAQGGTMTGGNSSITQTATSTFDGYYYAENNNAPVQVIDDDGYITTNGDTIGKEYTTNATWTAQWSGGAVTLPNAQRPGWTLVGWKTSGNCGGSLAGTPGQHYTPDGNIMLYACWTNVPYYIITLADGSYNDIIQNGMITGTNGGCTRAGLQYGQGWLNICDAPLRGALSLSQIPKRPNHVFNGYWAELAGGASGVDSQVVTKDGEFWETSEVLNGFVSDSTITAYWQPKYLITLNPNGGSGGDTSIYEGYGVGWSKTQNGDYTDTITVTKPQRTGYTFSGYYDDPNFGIKYIPRSGVVSLSPATFSTPKTLYAHWSPRRYTITLNDNGGSGGQVGDASSHCTTADLVYGTRWENGCDSGGAVYDRGASGSGEGDKTETGESGEGGSGEKAASSSSNTGSSSLSLYPPLPTRDGYIFNGYWNTSASSGGTMIVTPQGAFREVDAALTFTSQDATIYARWESGTPSNTIYTITLDPNNNGADGNRPPKIYQKGTSFWADSSATDYPITGSVFDPIADGGAGITRPTPPSGKAFSGYWDDRMTERFTDADGNIVATAYFTGAATVNAHWGDAATTTVTLDANNGTPCATRTVTATQGHDMPTLTCGPTPPPGYDFTGYYKTEYGGWQYYDEQPASVHVWDQTTSTATIYAGYEPAVRDVSYLCNSGGIGSANMVDQATYGSEYTIKDFSTVGCNAIIGKKFIGWTISGSNTFVEPGKSYQNWPYYTDLTLVAKYLDIYTVTLRHPDATNSPMPRVAYVIPYTSDSAGYEGWYSESTADTPLVAMITAPQRPLYDFTGYFYLPDGDTQSDEIQIVRENGYFFDNQETLELITSDGVADAAWKPVSPELTITTTSLPANTTFRFYIGATGEFVITWGDGQTQTVSSPGIVSHTYSSAGARTIDIVGDATSYTDAYTTGTIYNTGRVAESSQWSNNAVRPIQINFPAAIRFGCEAEDTSCALTPQLISAVHGSLGDVFPTLGTGNTQQPRFSRTFAGCTNLTNVPEDLFGGVYGAAIPGMFYGTFEDSGLVSVGQNLFSGITSFAPHAFQRTFMGSDLSTVPAGLFSHISGAPAEAMFAYTFANTPLRSIPSGIFSGVVGAPAVDMFWGTFSGVPFVYGNTLPALFSGISGAPAKGMFDSTFYNSYNLTGTIPANLFGGTNLSGVPAERMFASTFYGCYNLSGSIPANLFGGMGLTGASAVGMFDTTFFACIGLSGYVPMTLFGGISTSNPAADMMNHVFQHSGLLPVCPCGTHDYTTGFESYWDGKVSCEVGLKPNEHWYGDICVEDCAAGITQIRTSTGLSFQILKTKPTEHAIHISAPSDGTVCYVPLESGLGGTDSMNVAYSGTTYHLGIVSDTAPANWDPLASS